MYETVIQRTSTLSSPSGITASGLGRRYGDLWALRDLDLDVPAGSVLGLLGHNGAGKTTAIRVLTTLAHPTTGTARVAGFDVASEPQAVREHIGVTGQAATVDDLLTARANLELIGRLYHLPRRDIRARADELLERLGLAGDADRLVRTFSGGMRRRVDLAASLMARPPVLFLDEPTTGLDPESRIELWDVLRGLVNDGTTVLLTTQYLEEADVLADRIVVLRGGRTVANGSPAELKARIGGERVVASLNSAEDLAPAARALTPFADGGVAEDREALHVSVPVAPGTRFVEIVRALDAARVDVTDVHRREATLDDVFLSLNRQPALPAEEVAA